MESRHYWIIVRNQNGRDEYLTRSKKLGRRSVWTEDRQDKRIKEFGTDLGALAAATRLLSDEGIMSRPVEVRE